MLTSVFVLVNGIVFSGSNGLIIQCLEHVDELKEVKFFKEAPDFKILIM